MDNSEQFAYWNGEGGKRWAKDDATMARLLEPVCLALLDHARIEGFHSALDVGCGGGSQTDLLARRLGGGAKVLGVDISAPMLAVAASRAGAAREGRAAVEFMQADAAGHPFAPASFDLIFSRFGVMFFDDPVAAFTHLHGALRPGGRLVFCCWQAMKDNEWMRVPVQAALQHVPPPPKADPHAPGPCAFADGERLCRILSQAGYHDIDLHAWLTRLHPSTASDPDAAARDLARVGPVSRLLAGQPDDVLEKAYGSLAAALAPHFLDGRLELGAAAWFVTASA